jgi:thioredoxin-like negative regulator of GroEL
MFIDADNEIELLKKFEIKSVPTYILIEDGLEVARMNGAKTRDQFLEFINNEH